MSQGRPRIYESVAEKQQAYRINLAERLARQARQAASANELCYAVERCRDQRLTVVSIIVPPQSHRGGHEIITRNIAKQFMDAAKAAKEKTLTESIGTRESDSMSCKGRSRTGQYSSSHAQRRAQRNRQKA